VKIGKPDLRKKQTWIVL